MGTFGEKVAIITGGASGIGRALGEELARRGANVILVDLNEPLLKKTVESIRRAGYDAKGARLDVTDVEEVKRVVNETVAEHGRLDYIFNNAGILVMGEAKDHSYRDWRSEIDINLYGVVNGVFAAYPVMIRQGFGHIINTASLAGLIPLPGELPYTVSKYGVVGLSHTLRLEGAAYGVKTTVVCPGIIKTSMEHNAKMVCADREKVLDITNINSMPADQCARIILHGVERNKATIVVTRLAKILCVLQRISPTLTFYLLGRFLKRMRDAGMGSKPQTAN
jgi:NAD(P)-dependent dehydrogenase (short-subunit alcohol dehydrogenase family)